MPNYNNPYSMLPQANNYAFPTSMTQAGNPQMQSTNPYSQTNPMSMTQFPTDMSQQGMSVVWVEGEIGAKSYPLARGASVIMFDTTPGSDKFWMKSSDPYMGRPTPVRQFKYIEETGTSQMSGAAQPDMSKFVSRDEYDKLQNELMDMKKIVDQLK